MVDFKFILVNDSVGKDAPKKKPKIIPAKVVIMSLIVSFVLLLLPLRGGIISQSLLII